MIPAVTRSIYNMRVYRFQFSSSSAYITITRCIIQASFILDYAAVKTNYPFWKNRYAKLVLWTNLYATNVTRFNKSSDFIIARVIAKLWFWVPTFSRILCRILRLRFSICAYLNSHFINAIPTLFKQKKKKNFNDGIILIYVQYLGNNFFCTLATGSWALLIEADLKRNVNSELL